MVNLSNTGANLALTDFCYVKTGTNGGIAQYVDSRLLALTGDMSQMVPEIAERWELKDNTLTFYLRKNAFWHDGTPVTAKDVVFTFNTLIHPKTGSRYAVDFRAVQGFDALEKGQAETATGITAPDDNTVVVQFSRPAANFLNQVAIFHILPSHLLADVPKDKICEAPFWTQKRVGSGPFKVTKFIPGQRVEMEAFDQYFLGRPQLDKLNMIYFTNAETALAAFEKKEVHIVTFTPENTEHVGKMPHARVETAPNGVGSLWINVTKPPMGNVKARQALSYAVDRAAVSKSIFKGLAEPVTTEMSWNRQMQPADAILYTYDPAKARALLAEAGWKPNTEPIILWYYYADQTTAAAMEAVQQYFQAVGVNVKPQLAQGATLAEHRKNNTWNFIYGSLGGFSDPSVLGLVFYCKNMPNFGHWCNPRVDELLDKGAATMDMSERAKYYREAIKIITEEAPWVWYWTRTTLIAINKSLKGPEGTFGPVWLPSHNYSYKWTLTQ